MFDINERVKKLESICGGNIPGTSLTRILTKDGMAWTLGLGEIHKPKMFYIGQTIEEVFDKAEKGLVYG